MGIEYIEQFIGFECVAHLLHLVDRSHDGFPLQYCRNLLGRERVALDGQCSPNGLNTVHAVQTQVLLRIIASDGLADLGDQMGNLRRDGIRRLV